MSSKTSFFSPALFRQGLKRFWPLSIAVLIVVIIEPGLGILAADNGNYPDPFQVYAVANNHIYGAASPMVVLMAMACILTALLVFRYLVRRSSIRFFHGLPASRTTTFGTAYITGLVLIACPLVLGLLLCWVFATIISYGLLLSGPIFALMGASLACLLLFFSLASLACILSGNALGAILVYLAINCTVPALLVGFSPLIGILMPGINLSILIDGPLAWLAPVFCCANDVNILWSENPNLYSTAIGFQHPYHLVIHAIAGIILAFFSGWVYRIRKDEMAGETIAFPVVGTLCKVIFALVVTAIGAAAVVLISDEGFSTTAPLLVIHLVFAIIGWFAAEMIMRRSLKVVNRSSIISCTVLLACILLASGLVAVDICGVARKVPDKGEVKALNVNYDGHYLVLNAEDGVQMHQQLVENKDLLGTQGTMGISYNTRSLSLDYEMEDGSTFSRAYTVKDAGSGNAVETLMRDALDKPEYLHQYWTGLALGNVTQDNIKSATVYYYPEEEDVYLHADEAVRGEILPDIDSEGIYADGEVATIQLDAQETWSLYQTLCDDLLKGRKDIYSVEHYGFVEFCWEREISSEETELYGSRNRMVEQWFSVDLSTDMTSTMAWVGAHI